MREPEHSQQWPREESGETTTELVLRFVEEIRDDYQVGMPELLAVQELLLRLAARGGLPPPLELGRFLRPILCSNRREQENFAQRYAAFLEGQAPHLRLRSVAPSPELDTRARDWKALERNSLLVNVAAFALLGFLAVAGAAKWEELRRTTTTIAPASSNKVEHVRETPSAGPSPPAPAPLSRPIEPKQQQSQPPPVVVTPTAAASPALTAVLVALLGLVALAARALWVRQRALAFLSTSVAHSAGATAMPDAETVLLELRAPTLGEPLVLKQVGTALRARTASGVRELDLPGSLELAARHGGWFSEVWRERTSVPEYLFLLDRRHPCDFESARHDALLAPLAASGVRLQQLYFDGDASVVYSSAVRGRPSRIAELAAYYHACRVGIFAEPAALFDPITQEPAAWLTSLLSWTAPVLLTSDSLDPALPWNARLRAAGVRIVDASPAGLAAAFARRSAAPDASEALRAPQPSALRGDPRVWLGAEPPDEELTLRALAQLRLYLGKDGYFWLSACALHPQLRFALALELGTALEIPFKANGGELLRRLSGLPWMRAAQLPDWLRRRLLADLTLEERETARRALEQVLVNAALGGGESAGSSVFRNEPALVRSVYGHLSRAWQRGSHIPSPLEDKVYVAGMQDDLGVRLQQSLSAVAQAFVRQARADLPRRDIVQCWYGGVLGGYFSQLTVAALPLSQTNWCLPFALLAVGLAVGAVPPRLLTMTWGWRWRWLIPDAWVRAVVVLGALGGAAFAHVDFNFGEAPSDSQNVAMALAAIVALGFPLAVTERWLLRGILTVSVLGAFTYYKLEWSRNLWHVTLSLPGFSLDRSGLSLEQAFVLASALLPVAVALGLLGAVAQRLWRPAGALLLRWHDTLDRFAPDRLLFDRSPARPLPAGRLRTALGALGLGCVFGTVAAGGWADVIWVQVVQVACILAFVAYPYVAALRYRQREGSWAALRSGWEYVLLTAVTVTLISTEHSGLRWATLLLAIVSWGTSTLSRFTGSERARVIVEHNAPDRLLGTSPSFFGVVYAALLSLALFDLSWRLRPNAWTSVPAAAPSEPSNVPAASASSSTGGSTGTTGLGGLADSDGASGSSLRGQEPVADPVVASGGSPTTVVVADDDPSQVPKGGTGAGPTAKELRENAAAKEENAALKVIAAQLAKLTTGSLQDSERTQLSRLCQRYQDGACQKQLAATQPAAPKIPPSALAACVNECTVARTSCLSECRPSEAAEVKAMPSVPEDATALDATALDATALDASGPDPAPAPLPPESPAADGCRSVCDTKFQACEQACRSAHR